MNPTIICSRRMLWLPWAFSQTVISTRQCKIYKLSVLTYTGHVLWMLLKRNHNENKIIFLFYRYIFTHIYPYPKYIFKYARLFFFSPSNLKYLEHFMVSNLNQIFSHHSREFCRYTEKTYFVQHKMKKNNMFSLNKTLLSWGLHITHTTKGVIMAYPY